VTAISAAGREFATEDVFEAGWQAALQHLQLDNRPRSEPREDERAIG